MPYNNSSSLSPLLEMLGIEASYDHIGLINSIIHSPQHYYRVFHIPKRKGGLRKINSPYPTLYDLHKKTHDNVLNNVKIHSKAFAYVKDKSAIDHARYHCACKELLTLDIKDFFPSISRQKVFDVFSSLNISTDCSNYLSYICTLNNELPQGACTSPVLSNAIFYKIDLRLDKLATSFGLKYSRYADDLAFSGTRVPRRIIKIISSILAEYDFDINKSKTTLKTDGSRKIITGVSISEGVMKAPKKFKRALRAQIYELELNIENVFLMSNFDPLIYEKVIGKLNYFLQIEPDNEYAKSKRALLIDSYKKFIAVS